MTGSDFYRMGFVNVDFEQSVSLKKLDVLLKDISKKDIVGHPNFIERYPDTFDYDKTGIEVVEILVDFILDQGILEIISDIQGVDYYLGDLALRKTFSRASYMNWHRDTYFDRHERQIGRIPSLIKLIYYPKYDGNVAWQLKVIPGSHRRIFSRPAFDKLQPFLFFPQKVFPSNSSAVLFDSSIQHAAAPGDSLRGSLRLIYNFCVKSQLDTFSNSGLVQPIFNKRLQERYE